MSTSHRRLVAVLFVVGVGALAGAFGAHGAGSHPAGERAAPGGQPSIWDHALGIAEPAMVREPGATRDRLSRVVRAEVATTVLTALVSMLVAIWCTATAPRLRFRNLAVLCASPRGPPLRST